MTIESSTDGVKSSIEISGCEVTTDKVVSVCGRLLSVAIFESARESRFCANEIDPRSFARLFENLKPKTHDV